MEAEDKNNMVWNFQRQTYNIRVLVKCATSGVLFRNFQNIRMHPKNTEIVVSMLRVRAESF